MSAEIEVIGLDLTERPVHSEQIEILGERAGTAEIRRHQAQRHARVLDDLEARLNQFLARERRIQAGVAADEDDGH